MVTCSRWCVAIKFPAISTKQIDQFLTLNEKSLEGNLITICISNFGGITFYTLPFYLQLDANLKFQAENALFEVFLVYFNPIIDIDRTSQ